MRFWERFLKKEVLGNADFSVFVSFESIRIASLSFAFGFQVFASCLWKGKMAGGERGAERSAPERLDSGTAVVVVRPMSVTFQIGSRQETEVSREAAV